MLSQLQQPQPPSAQELLRSLQELRSDPVVASVLRGDGGGDAGEQSSSHHNQRHRLRALNASPTRSTAPSNADMSRVAVAQSGQTFLRGRDADREAAGVGNWLSKHRDELAQSELKRVENRLKAERLFAQSKMDVERLQLEAAAAAAARRKSDSIERGVQATSVASGEHAGGDDVDHAQAAAAGAEPTARLQSSGIAEGAGRGGLGPVQSAAPATTTAALTSLSHAPATTAPSTYVTGYRSPFMEDIQRFSPSVIINTTDALGPIDETSNYEAKVAALQASSVLQQQPQGTSGAAGPHLSSSPTHNRFGGSLGSSEMDALREAVQHRDRVIARLEKKLADDRAYFEDVIETLKAEAQEERMVAEGRVAALRAQIDQLVTARAGRSAQETTVEELTLKLQAVQRMYKESVDTMKRKAAEQHELLVAAADERVRAIQDRAEEAIRTARHAYTLERTEYLANQKDHLVDMVSREQSLRLKEMETVIKGDVFESVKQRIEGDIEGTFRKYLESELVPAVREQLRRDTLQMSRSALGEWADLLLKGKQIDMIKAAQQACDEYEANSRQSFAETAQTVISRALSQPAPSPVASTSTSIPLPQGVSEGAAWQSSTISAVQMLQTAHGALQVALKQVAVDESQEASLDALHGEKMSLYARRIQQAESNLEAERQFSVSMAQQLHQTLSPRDNAPVDAVASITQQRPNRSSDKMPSAPPQAGATASDATVPGIVAPPWAATHHQSSE